MVDFIFKISNAFLACRKNKSPLCLTFAGIFLGIVFLRVHFGLYFQSVRAPVSAPLELQAQVKLLLNSVYFTEVVSTWAESLSLCKIPFKIVSHIEKGDSSVYVIFDVKSFVECDSCTHPINFIVYNMEQLSAQGLKSNLIHSLQKLYRHARMVLDYSLINTALLLRSDISSIFLPYGSPIIDMNSISTNVKRINVLFIGELNQRRSKYLGALRQRKQILTSKLCFENCLKEKLSKSKIVLNIHFFSQNTVLEVTRIIPLVMNKIWVISERSSENYYDDRFRDVISFVSSPEEMSNAIDVVLSLSQEDIARQLEWKSIMMHKNCNFFPEFLNFITNHGLVLMKPSQSNTLVTFVVPSQGRMSLQFTLNSFLDQTNPNWRAIIIFDGPESTAVLKYQPTDSRIIYFIRYSKMSSSESLRNFGVHFVDSNWVAFIEEDVAVFSSYVQDLASHTGRFKNVDCFIFRMAFCNQFRHNEVIPRFEDSSISVLNVGSSFAVQRRVFFQGHHFKPSSFENYHFLRSIHVHKKNIIISDNVHYFSQCESFDAMSRVRQRVQSSTYPIRTLNRFAFQGS